MQPDFKPAEFSLDIIKLLLQLFLTLIFFSYLFLALKLKLVDSGEHRGNICSSDLGLLFASCVEGSKKAGQCGIKAIITDETWYLEPLPNLRYDFMFNLIPHRSKHLFVPVTHMTS